MDVHAVLGEEGVGTTATAVNLAVALRQAGHHAAVLDLTGDVAALLGIPTAGSDESDGERDGDRGAAPRSTLADGGSVAAATVDAPLDADVRGTAARDDPGTSGATVGPGGEPGDGSVASAEPDHRPVDHLPVVVAGDRTALAAAPPDRRESVRGDLAFAYDQVIVDAGDPDASDGDDGVVGFADGRLVVTTPDDAAVRAATDLVRACSRAGGLVVGAVLNRADDGMDASAVRERMRTEVVGVIPADDRTPDLEPTVHGAPGSPAATAYRRLAATVADWSGESGLVDGGPELDPDADPGGGRDAASGSGPASGRAGGDGDATPRPDDGPAHPLDGDGDDGGDSTDDEDGGLLSRFF